MSTSETQNILSELYEEVNVELPPLELNLGRYNTDRQRNEAKFDQLLIKFRRFLRLKQHRYALYFAYHLGKILDETIPRDERQVFHSKLSRHYLTGIVRVHFLFDTYGPEHIFITRIITFQQLRHLKEQDYKSLFNLIGAQS